MRRYKVTYFEYANFGGQQIKVIEINAGSANIQDGVLSFYDDTDAFTRCFASGVWTEFELLGPTHPDAK